MIFNNWENDPAWIRQGVTEHEELWWHPVYGCAEREWNKNYVESVEPGVRRNQYKSEEFGWTNLGVDD